jgi:hypothetical protein
VCDLEAAREELGYDPWWKAWDYLLATEPLPTRFDLEVPMETTRSLRFVKDRGAESPVFVAPGRLDRQTMRGVRELTPASAAALEALIRPAGARRLRPYENYTREEVHDIFAPDTHFAPQRGTWGMHGIVAIPDRPGDYVFFVTLGQRQGEHAFDEGITEDGVLTWQSQPRQGLDDRHVRRFIEHDELRNSIYLFFRPRRRGDYTYFGRLKYLSHDAEREYPVYFQWQILDWNPPEDVLRRVGIVLQPPAERAVPGEEGELRQTPSPTRDKREGTSTPSFRGHKKADYSTTEHENRGLGIAGELLVIRRDSRVLTEGGRPDLARRVRHVSLVEGDGAGYDVGFFTLGGVPKYIEVKTTRGPAETPFFVTANEVAFSEAHSDGYHLYRVYDYDDERDAGMYYTEAGSLSSRFALTPTQFRVTLRIRRGKD